MYNEYDEYEVNNDPSETQGDMAMSIAEILVRHSRGLSIPDYVIHEPSYNGGNLSPLSTKGIDLADMTSIKEASDEEIRSAISTLQSEQAERNKQSGVGSKSEAIRSDETERTNA